ncbi:MAG: DUF2283 domain-containing protein [Gemmatimonadaceae bacterium]|nr:DUF2283 domain-containing protein [Gemmatimonadaceae bacterium]
MANTKQTARKRTRSIAPKNAQTAKAPRMSYDPAVDAAAIVFVAKPHGRPVTRELAPHIRADYVGEQLVAFEILDASAILPLQVLQAMGPAGAMLTILEAAAETRREPQTIRKAIAAGKIVGAEKDGRDWRVPRHALLNYIEQLKPAGRPLKSAAR